MAQTQTIGRMATTVKTENGITRVTYHWTDVVTFGNGKIVLNHNNWKTATTKNRMNQTSNQFELGYVVYQRDFDWFVDYKGKTYEFENSKLELTI